MTLMAQMEEHSKAIEKVRLSDKFCARCEDLAVWAMATATHQLGKAQYALREYSRRYPQVLRDLDSEREKKEELAKEKEEWIERVEIVIKESEEGENCLRTMAEEEKKEAKERLRRMAEEKREVETERDQLRAALAVRGESGEKGVTPPPRDTESEEVEMREEISPSPSSADIAPTILGALEGWFEAKWG